jgi:hypothetical protein
VIEINDWSKWNLLVLIQDYCVQKVPFEVPLPPTVKAIPKNDASAVDKMDGMPFLFTDPDFTRSMQKAVISFANRWFLVSFICALL